MSWLRTALIAALVLPFAPGCGGDKCVKAGAKLDCPDGYVGYGRRTPNRNKGWLPIFSLADLSTWAAGDSFDEGGACETACVPAALGEPEDFSVCDTFQPCGGDLTGDWRWDGYPCPYEVPVDMYGVCADAVQTLAESNDGTVSFEDDGSARFTASGFDSVDTLHIPASCSADQFDACEDLVGVGDGCQGDPTQGCTCSGTRSSGSDTWEGTWVQTGTVLTLERGGEEYEIDYCVDGDRLILLWPEDASGTRVREHLFRFVN